PEDTRQATPEQLSQLADLLGMTLADVQRRLVDPERTFVYIKRQVSLAVADQIRELKVPGFHQQPEVRRFYPEAEVTAHVLGFTNIEDKGIEGVELSFNEALSGKPGSRRVIKDRLGRVIEDVQAIVPPVNGQDLYLSIDAGLQFDVYAALKKALAEHEAKAGAG